MISDEANKLITELKLAPDPNAFLGKLYSKKKTLGEKKELNETVGELEKAGLIKVVWADNIAYHIDITADGKNYDKSGDNRNETMIILGNNNRIVNSNIGVNNSINGESEKKSFWEKHPFALAIISAVIAAFIMMFSFWKYIVEFIEGLFK